MKGIRFVLLLVLAALLFPEFSRYGAERELRALTGAATAARDATSAAIESRRASLRRVAADAAHMKTYPGDWRPLQVSASATLLAGDALAAIERYRRCLANGERPDLMYELGVAYVNARDSAAADGAFLRASWFSSAIAAGLDARAPTAYVSRTLDIERRLNAGTLRLSDLPPPPPLK